MPEVAARVAVLGIGYSGITRGNETQSLGDDAILAANRAISDAGLQSADIDGLTTYKYRPDGHGRNMVPDESIDGSLVVSPQYLWRRMRFPNLRWGEWNDKFVGSSMIEAHNAVATFVSGLRAHNLLSGRGFWAENKPVELSTEEYLSARMIAEPFGLYDCDMPVQGCVAYVLGPAQAAQDLDHGAAFIKGFAQSYAGAGGSSTFLHLGGAPGTEGFSLEYNQEAGRRLAANLWAATGLSPSDIDTANLYDGFGILAWTWLEGLGFCKEGEAFEFVQHGRVRVGGQLPLNTSGGNLGEGRLAGAPHVSEAIYQAMGRAGRCQVPDVRYTLAATDRLAVGQAIVFGSQAE